MKTIIYKNPVISAVAINITTLIILIYSIRGSEYWLYFVSIYTGVINRNIVDNSFEIDKRKKTIIFISLFFMVIISLTYAFYRHNVIVSQIINGS